MATTIHCLYKAERANLLKQLFQKCRKYLPKKNIMVQSTQGQLVLNEEDFKFDKLPTYIFFITLI